MVAVRNISTGPRGAWQGATLVMAEPGEVIEADDFEPEWFEVVGKKDAGAAVDAEATAKVDPPAAKPKARSKPATE